MCGYLLGEGAQIDSREAQSMTPLQFACEAAFFTAVDHGHVQVAEIFFLKGLRLQDLKRDRNKPLELAATSGCLAMVDLMIQECCETRMKDDSGWNALHFASYRGHYQVIERLLSSGVSATAKTTRKETPLVLAVKRGHSQWLRVFCDAKKAVVLQTWKMSAVNSLSITLFVPDRSRSSSF
ncbi:MAG: hypothetical protein Q9221_007759 [Calogaya cf. arnoldii]